MSVINETPLVPLSLSTLGHTCLWSLDRQTESGTRPGSPQEAEFGAFPLDLFSAWLVGGWCLVLCQSCEEAHRSHRPGSGFWPPAGWTRGGGGREAPSMKQPDPTSLFRKQGWSTGEGECYVASPVAGSASWRDNLAWLVTARRWAGRAVGTCYRGDFRHQCPLVLTAHPPLSQ